MDRKSWINLRGISIISVIIIHITAGKYIGTNYSSLFNLFLNQITRFSVAIFLISSGYGLALKKDIINKSDLMGFYRKRLKIVPGYVIWSCLYYLIHNYPAINILELLKGILYGTTAGHLYFMIVLIFSYLVFPFIKNFSSTHLGMLSFLLIAIIGQLSYQSGITWGEPYVWNWFFYFVLGIYLAIHNKILKQIANYSL